MRNGVLPAGDGGGSWRSLFMVLSRVIVADMAGCLHDVAAASAIFAIYKRRPLVPRWTTENRLTSCAIYTRPVHQASASFEMSLDKVESVRTSTRDSRPHLGTTAT